MKFSATLKLRAISFLKTFYNVILDIVRRPSIAYLLAAIIVTYIGKMMWYIDILSKLGTSKMGFLSFFAEDLLVMGLLVALMLGVEWAFPKKLVKIILASVAFVVAVLCTLNVAWLNKTGLQLTSAVIEIGLTRFDEIKPIIQHEMGWSEALLLLGVVIMPPLLSVLFFLKWKVSEQGERNLFVFLFPAFLILLSAQGYWQQQKPSLFGWKMIAGNILYSITSDLAKEDRYSPLPKVPQIVTQKDLFKIDPDSRKNILIVLMESLSHRATSLGHAKGTTPFLKNFSAAGMEVTTMRVIMPHSTKTLFSTLCGKIPALQQEVVETADNFPMNCMPALFSQIGYETAFMQASKGNFEDLPRLADRIGFDEFYDYYNIEPTPELLGYLSADDRVLERAAIDWIDSTKAPFFLTIFTSVTHHPYVLPERLKEFGSEIVDPSERQIAKYLRLVLETDQIVESILTELNNRGILDNTIVVLMGDHGESFGDHGKYQHDNIYTDEGIRIPFAINAKDLIQPNTKITGNRSVVDLYPTILELFNIPYQAKELDGVSLLKPVPRDVKQRFACFYNDTCIGEIRDITKNVIFPTLLSSMTFDLEKDPKEMIPSNDKNISSEIKDELEKWYLAHRYHPNEFIWEDRSLFDGQWNCSEGLGGCVSNLAENVTSASND